MKRFSSFINHDNGRKIFFQTWHPEEKPKATIIIAHGYAEHSGRYTYTAEYLVRQGFAVYAPDHYGHGKSDGTKADVPKFEVFTTDLYKLYTIAKNKEKNDIFLLGHSMGGAIGAHFAITHPDALKGIILSGPGIRVTTDVPPVMKALSKILAALFPALPVVEFDIEGISRNKDVIENYLNDPLTYTGKVRARMGRELLRVENLTSAERLSEISIPALILHGVDDRVVDPQCSRIIYDNISSEDKELIILPGLYHEILNSDKKDSILDTITEWINKRLQTGR